MTGRVTVGEGGRAERGRQRDLKPVASFLKRPRRPGLGQGFQQKPGALSSIMVSTGAAGPRHVGLLPLIPKHLARGWMGSRAADTTEAQTSQRVSLMHSAITPAEIKF